MMATLPLSQVARNSREAKKAVLYDGHNRKAGVSKANDTMRWRKIRRRVSRWLASIAESLDGN